MVEETPEAEFSVRDRRGRGAAPEPSPPGPGAGPSPPSETASPSRNASDAATPETSAAPPGPELASLFLMLASSAMVNLGEAADPVTREISRDLDQAQYLIDLLALLKKKTEGNRDPEESQLLEEILYDLQMRFVQAVPRR